jgi:hypothetical protein
MHVEDLAVMFPGRHWQKPFETLWRKGAERNGRVLRLPAMRVLSNSPGKVNKLGLEAGKEHDCWQAV